MDGGNQPGSQAGTPTQLHNPNHMMIQQGGNMNSPTIGQPMTPQMMQQPPHTPGGQYPQDYQQMHPQHYGQQVPQSPGGIPGHMQQPQMVGGGGEHSPGMYQRQMMQQQMMQQGHMNPMMGGSQQMQYQYPQGGQQPNQGQQVQQQQQQQTQQQQQQAQAQAQAQQQAQQQQWAQMQQNHYGRPGQVMGQNQAGQRVMITRVPYPAGPGYMPGQQPQFAGRGPPPNANPMQRPQYPPGSAASQYPSYPTGQPYPPQQQPQQQPPQQPNQQYPPQMYARTPVQPIRPYMSPQGPMVAPHQGAYPNNQPPSQQPQPQHPAQATFPPGNGNRFPPNPSPHFPAANDMRSPPIMSPTQAPVLPNGPPPSVRAISNGDIVGAPMRMPPNVAQPQGCYFAHEPLVNVEPDMCLAGCTFHIFDAERYNTDKIDISNIALAIKLHGGEVEFGQKTFHDKLVIITHVVVDCANNQVGQLAIKNRKRLVSLQWLCEVLQKKRMEVPSKLAHLPCCLQDRPLMGKFVSVSGFDEGERAAIKWMIEMCGGRMTPHFSQANNVLIAKNLGVEKTEKAAEWNIPVVNYMWLADHYMGHMRTDPDNARYQVGQQQCDVNSGPYVMETLYDFAKQMLMAWKIPIQVQQDNWARFMETKKLLDSDYNVFPNKRHRMQQHVEPSEEDIAEQEKIRQKDGIQPSVFVAFAGVEDDVKQMLSKKLRFLGGKEVENVSECTHLVAMQGNRTEPLLEAITLGKNIVHPYWIIHGYECRRFMDTLDYFLRDEDMEKNLGYSCKKSVIRARTRPVFEDYTFYVTPSVVPNRAMISKLIRLAGGKVDEERPEPAKIAEALETDTPYVVISCESDVKMIQYLLDCMFPVFSSEFVLMAILRQEVEAHPLYRVSVQHIRMAPVGRPFMRPSIEGQPTPTQQTTQPQRVRV